MYYFPFQSISFFTPQGHSLIFSNTYKTPNNVCKRLGEIILVKKPTVDNDDDKIIKMWDLIEREMDSKPDFKNEMRKKGIAKDSITIMTDDEIEEYIFTYLGEENETVKKLKNILNNNPVPLIALRPMLFNTLDPIGGIYLCKGKLNPLGYKIMLNDEIEKHYSETTKYITLQNVLQIIEDKLIEQNKNPSDFNISMMVCRTNDCLPPHPTTFYNPVKGTIKTTNSGGTTEKGIEFVNVDEDNLAEYLSGGSIHKKRKRKNKTKRKTKRKTKKKRKRI